MFSSQHEIYVKLLTTCFRHQKFFCKLCSERFSRTSNLKRHLKEVHGTEKRIRPLTECKHQAKRLNKLRHHRNEVDSGNKISAIRTGSTSTYETGASQDTFQEHVCLINSFHSKFKIFKHPSFHKSRAFEFYDIQTESFTDSSIRPIVKCELVHSIIRVISLSLHWQIQQNTLEHSSQHKASESEDNLLIPLRTATDEISSDCEMNFMCGDCDFTSKNVSALNAHRFNKHRVIFAFIFIVVWQEDTHTSANIWHVHSHLHGFGFQSRAALSCFYQMNATIRLHAQTCELSKKFRKNVIHAWASIDWETTSCEDVN